MSPRLRPRRAVFAAAVAAAVLGGLAFAVPAAASPSITPVVRPVVTITPQDQVQALGQTIHVFVQASDGQGNALDGSLTVSFTGPDGINYTYKASYFVNGADVSYRPTTAGARTVQADYTRPGIGASAQATATYSVKYGSANAKAIATTTTSGAKTPVTLVATLPAGSTGAGGTLTVRADPGGISASCPAAAKDATSAGCVATLPGVGTGTYTLSTSYTGSATYFDYFNTLTDPPVLTVKAASGASGTSGSSSGSKPAASAAASPAPSRSASAVASSSPRASAQAIAADPASDNSRGGTDPLILVIVTVGACAALAALGVALYVLLRRRRTPGAGD